MNAITLWAGPSVRPRTREVYVRRLLLSTVPLVIAAYAASPASAANPAENAPDDGGLPWWGWAGIVLAAIGIVILIVAALTTSSGGGGGGRHSRGGRRYDDGTGAIVAGTSGSDSGCSPADGSAGGAC